MHNGRLDPAVHPKRVRPEATALRQKIIENNIPYVQQIFSTTGFGNGDDKEATVAVISQTPVFSLPPSELCDLLPFSHVINCYLDCPLIIYVIIIKGMTALAEYQSDHTCHCLCPSPFTPCLVPDWVAGGSDTLTSVRITAIRCNLQQPLPDAFITLTGQFVSLECSSTPSTLM